ncbi:AHH domain-containing protein [Corallococcus sp. bb12-1]|uniref:AHH domain-containing protein n=1 Tax=Corallococcus sp. bb12-1 TaxID=2996784 RepID=UPI00226DB5A2|nr:AHH domain-containing protein [Corallococcus sp. bb12-1]MCY1046162.1 AHH domain-containing protein [Corallococcus sp. bb12-1]
MPENSTPPPPSPNPLKRRGPPAKKGKVIPPEARPEKKQKAGTQGDHLAWDGPFNNHKDSKGGHGCIWRHPIETRGWSENPCNYPLNGFHVSSDEGGNRYALYSADFRSRAEALGYVKEGEYLSDVVQQNIQAAGARIIAEGLRKEEGFNLKKYVDLAKTAFYWLKREDGWKINVSCSDSAPKPHSERSFKRNQPHFLPRQDKERGGHGAWYPYEHNYHHLIPIGAVEEWIVGRDDKSANVIQIVLMSGWNIHKRLNVMLLPQQEVVAEVVGLPAHCPWGVPSHKDYQDSLADKLKQIRDKIIRAAKGGKEHPDPEKIQFEFDDISEILFEKIKGMTAGRKLGKVRW